MQALIFIEAAGKAQAWARISAEIGLKARIHATSGHVCRFTDRLNPIGIDLDPRRIIDQGRRPSPEKEAKIVDAVRSMPPGAAIVLAMDNDPEGEVIAYDVVEIIVKHFPDRFAQLVRLRPGPITNTGIKSALSRAVYIKKHAREHTRASLPGRARAVTDRWIGSVFSRMAGISVGRVRSAVLGSVFLNRKHPDKLRGRVETGEITIQARPASGGLPFTARVRLTGAQNPEKVAALISLANRFENRTIPGTVRPYSSLSAAISPRIGQVRPFNTADAMAYASRHQGISTGKAYQGLQDAYLEGMISYPRTDSHEMSQESASRVVRLGSACGLDALEVSALSTEGRLATADVSLEGAHEALHPVFDLTSRNAERLRDLVRKPLKRYDEEDLDREQIRDIMAAIVSRRAFEACREVVLERGSWMPDNASIVDPQDAKILRDLEWFREQGKTFPWSRNLATGVRAWPLDAVILELMVQESVGRPSTYAAHVETAVRSGEIEAGQFPEPPRPTPVGMAALKRIPKSVWNPKVCRLIEAAMDNQGNLVDEDENADSSSRVRARVMFWLSRVPEEMRNPLIESLKESTDTRSNAGAGLAAMIPKSVQSDHNPAEFNPGLAEPSPFLS